jgi:hypothetical protein
MKKISITLLEKITKIPEKWQPNDLLNNIILYGMNIIHNFKEPQNLIICLNVNQEIIQQNISFLRNMLFEIRIVLNAHDYFR